MEDSKTAALRIQLGELFARVRSKRALASDYTELERIKFDCDPRWIAEIFSSETLHDEDYKIFRHFNSSDGTILDVGANYGYSVSSIRKAGSDCPIISFEVSPAFDECLKRVKEREAGRHDFIISGVSAERGTVEFLVPTVNGLTISALTSATKNFGEYTVESIVQYVKKTMPGADSYEGKILRLSCATDTIDFLLETAKLDVAAAPIAAIKIDVEGFEAEALSGARRTISANKPLLLVEGGNRPPAVKSFLDAANYRVAEREDSHIRLSSGYSQHVNGIFVHSDKIDIYRDSGMIQGGA